MNLHMNQPLNAVTEKQEEKRTYRECEGIHKSCQREWLGTTMGTSSLYGKIINFTGYSPLKHRLGTLEGLEDPLIQVIVYR